MSQQEAAGYLGSAAHLAWVAASDGSLALWHAAQPAYLCDEARLSSEMQALLDVVQSGKFHPADYQSPFCGNQFVGLVYLPRPSPEFAVLPEGQEDGFDQVADYIRKAQYESHAFEYAVGRGRGPTQPRGPDLSSDR